MILTTKEAFVNLIARVVKLNVRFIRHLLLHLTVSLNYQVSLKPDCAAGEGDIISLRGAGKGKITGLGGTSRKGRLFVYAEIYR